MASTNVLSRTLGSITNIKLEEISSQQAEFEAAKAETPPWSNWSVYTRFFSTSFGKPVVAYGLAHVDQLLETFARVQAKLFFTTRVNVISIVKKLIRARFGVDEIPEGYLFFPLLMGGLDLKSPFVSLYLTRGQIPKNSSSYVDDFFREEKRAYGVAKVHFEQSNNHHRIVLAQGPVKRDIHDL